MSTKQLHSELVGLVSTIIGTGDVAQAERACDALSAILTWPEAD